MQSLEKPIGRTQTRGWGEAQELLTVTFLLVSSWPSRPYTNFRSTLAGRTWCELIYRLCSFSFCFFFSGKCGGQECCTGDTWRSIKTWRAWIPWVGYIIKNSVAWGEKEEWHSDNRAPLNALWVPVTILWSYPTQCIGVPRKRTVGASLDQLSRSLLKPTSQLSEQLQAVWEKHWV